MVSHNKTTREVYPGLSDCAIWNFLFQRQFYQPDRSQQQLPHQQHVEAVIQRYFEGLPFFTENLLWWLLQNMKFRHQHLQQEENRRKKLATALIMRIPMKKKKKVQKKQTTNSRRWIRNWIICWPGPLISSHLEHKLEWI